MADFVLALGGVPFRDMEVPESIKGGGAQALFMHKYPGGARTADTTGPDDDPITWSGWFEDADAQQRCRQIDTIRRQGLPVVAAWAAFSFLVIVRKFTWDFRRFYHIRYSVELEVIQDQVQPLPQADPDLEQQIQGDFNDAVSDGAALDVG
jgi:hypothetical protein